MNPRSIKIMNAYMLGGINSYMAKRLMKANEFGMTDQLLDDALSDASSVSKLKIESDRDYCLNFFTSHFIDDILNHTFDLKISPEDKKQLCEYILDHKGDDNYEFDNLTDFRILIHKWLNNKHLKKAYPNTSGKTDKESTYDVNKWINTVKIIYSLVKDKDTDKQSAIEFSTLDWDADEKYKFTNWLNYYESGNTEKYNVKTAIQKNAIDYNDLGLPSYLLDPNTRSNTLPSHLQQPNVKHTKKEKELERARAYRRKMKSRLISLKRLIDKYNDILPHQSVDQLYDEMYSLDKSISKLNVYASMQDCTIRTANKMNKIGFSEGASVLLSLAQEPLSVEPALESLPSPKSSEPDLQAGKSKVDIKNIISRLEALSKTLKSRDTIRELASIDILLNEIGMASYFPELTDAQSKLIDSYGYSSNRIESIIAKLRGTGKSSSGDTTPVTPKQESPMPAPSSAPQPAPIPPPISAKPVEEKINTEELRSKPVGEVQKTLPIG